MEALVEAIKKNDFRKLRQIIDIESFHVLEYRGDNFESPLHIAAKYDAYECAKIIIDEGFKVDDIATSGATPLIYAIVSNAVNTARLLISKGASMIVKEGGCLKTGLLHAAARSNAVDCMDLLIEKGLGINAMDRNGETPLGIALRHNSKDAAKYLVERLINLNNAKGALGGNALHSAIDWGDIELVKLLLVKGIDINYESDFVRKPYDYAIKMGENEIADLLLLHGAKSSGKQK